MLVGKRMKPGAIFVLAGTILGLQTVINLITLASHKADGNAVGATYLQSLIYMYTSPSIGIFLAANVGSFFVFRAALQRANR